MAGISICLTTSMAGTSTAQVIRFVHAASFVCGYAQNDDAFDVLGSCLETDRLARRVG
jgi:hypothetical protein